MGFENRDYYREPDWGGGRSADSSAIRWIIVLSVVVFLAQQVPDWQIKPFLALTSEGVLSGQVWRLVTYAFCHGGLMHIVFNLLGLWWFGRVIEERLGAREFIGFYLAAAIVAGLANIGLNAALKNPLTSTTGASGSLMAVMAIFVLLYPRQQVMFMGLVPVEMRWLIAGYVVSDTLLMFSPGDRVAHAAHLGGLLFGFVYQIFEMRLTDWLPSRGFSSWWRDRNRRQSMRLYTPDSEPSAEPDLDSQVDDILRKIHEKGESSLTDAERKLLTEASRRIRERMRT